MINQSFLETEIYLHKGKLRKQQRNLSVALTLHQV